MPVERRLDLDLLDSVIRLIPEHAHLTAALHGTWPRYIRSLEEIARQAYIEIRDLRAELDRIQSADKQAEE